MPYPENHDTEPKITLASLLATSRNGDYDNYLTSVLEEVAKAVIEFGGGKGGKGSITVRFDVELLDEEEGGASRVLPVLTSVKKPARKLKPSIMFIDKDGSFSRTDLRQMELLDHKPREDGDITRLGRGGIVDMQANR